MRNSLRLASALMLLVCSAAEAQTDPRGLYVYSWEVAATASPSQTTTAGVQELLTALTTHGVDGITLVQHWSVIQPTYSSFEWTGIPSGTSPLDLWIQAAIDAGKHVNLVIDAGQDTPCWLFRASTATCSPSYHGVYAGATALNFMVSAHQGRGACITETIAAPWDPVFLSAWQNMLSNLSAYLKSVRHGDGTEYDAITMVRLTGINRTTDEFRLPAEILSTTHGADCDTNSVQTWLTAGYQPSLLFSAWDQITDDFLVSFGDKYVNVPIIPTNSGSTKNRNAGNGQFPFPPIDDNGCVYLSGIPTYARSDFAANCTHPAKRAVQDQNLRLITLAAQKFPGKLTVEYENLHFQKGKPAAPSSTVVHYAETLGVSPAFQTNNYYGPFPKQPGGTSCGPLGNLKRCSPLDYQAMVEAGISPDATDSSMHSQFIEIFFPDIDGKECASVDDPPAGCGYPNEIGLTPHPNLHDEVVAPPVVTISFPAPSPLTHWYTTRPQVGQVKATAATGHEIVTLQCTGAASGSGLAGFSLDLKSQGNPDLVKCMATDDAGHSGESVRALWVDTEAPVTVATVRTENPLGDQQVNLAATDNLSGVAKVEYRIDGGPWIAGTQFSLLHDGTYTIQFRATDVAGNVESTKSLFVTVVITPPVPCKGVTCK
jgi:hypothetical protein